MVAPRGDSADILVKELNARMLLFCNKHHILLCDHNNLVQRDGIICRFFSQDKVYLSEEGNKVFSTNLSYAIRTALKIQVIPKRKRSKTPSRRANRGQRRYYRGRGGYRGLDNYNNGSHEGSR